MANNTSSAGAAADSSQEQSLLFLFDLETTGLDVDTVRITEVAGKVFNPPATVYIEPFSHLVNIPDDIDFPENVQKLTGITRAKLQKKGKPLSKVLPEFFSWISTSTQEMTEDTGKPHHPVLVAHNGYKFDVPILMNELRRIEFDTSTLVKQKMFFADTKDFLTEEKKQAESSGDKNNFLYGKSLRLMHLHELCFRKGFRAHRALADVEAMERILRHPKLAHLPTSLPQKPASKFL